MVLRRVEEQSHEPGKEPGTWMEDFIRGPIIAEEIQHPDDWDPETHGDIPAGKGSPPPAYFERMKGRGKGRGKDEEEEEKGGAKGGKKGRRVGSSHGDHGEALGLMSSPSSSTSTVFGKGPGKGFDGDLPPGCGGKGGGRPPIYVTPYGSKFHTRAMCSSLHRSRALPPSHWCESCLRENDDGTSRDWAIIAGPGRVAHADGGCQLITGRKIYRKCGLCQELERTRG